MLQNPLRLLPQTSTMTAQEDSRILPPTDGSVPFENIIDFHLEHNPKHTWAILAGIDENPSISINYEQFAYAVHRAAHIVNPNGQVPSGTKIGILVSADSMVYIALILGAMRAGLVVSRKLIGPKQHIHINVQSHSRSHPERKLLV